MRELFIRKLIKMVEQSDIDSLEVSSWGRSVRINKNRGSGNGHSSVTLSTPAPTRLTTPPLEQAAPPRAAEPAPEPAPEATKPADGSEIKSPMVGTFYRAPSPDARPYVEVGDHVREGQTICIVEAMKLMNEIQAEVGGTITAIHVENGQPVEYGQALFTLKKD